MISSPDQLVNTVSFSVARLIDQFGRWLSALPGGPVTDLISGGVWLLRRSLFPVGAEVGLWGIAACVTTGDCSSLNLSGADLYGQDLSGINFTAATLTQANLGTAKLTVADLSNANLTGANLASANLAGAAARSANLTGANLTEAALVNADLAGADLSSANLSLADLTGANINLINANGVIWDNTTCPDGSSSSTGCGPVVFSETNKPGLLASDWLRVNSETGDTKFLVGNGDEPILLTANLTTTLGLAGSSKSNLVDSTPNQIASGVDAGQTVGIPDETGDNWVNYWSETDADGNVTKGFVPLGISDIGTSAYLGRPVSVPMILSVTMALEGDMSNPKLVGGLGTMFIQDKLDALGKELEATKIYLGSGIKSIAIEAGGSGYTTAPTVTFSGGRVKDLDGIDAKGTAILTNGVVSGVTITNPGTAYVSAPTVTFTGGDGTGAAGTAVLVGGSVEDQLRAVLDDAQKRIVDAVSLKWYDFAGLIMKRIGDWGLSIGDPDDPVGLGATILIPVDSSIVTMIKELGGPTNEKFKLDSNYTKLVDFDTKTDGQQDFDLRTPVWDTNIQVRVGLLIPPEPGNTPQVWTTNYAGDYLDNTWANWTVETKAWGKTSW